MSIRVALLYVCFFTSGAAALVYEVVWQRMLTLVFGVATFSVAAVVSAFLAGLALGCRLFGGLADRSANPLRLYAGVELGIAVTGLASVFFVPLLLRAFQAIHAAADPGWLGSNAIRFGLAFIALGVPSLLIGGTVPIMSRLIAERARSVAVGFGRIYAVNTLGSVAGAALAGFLLIRVFGVRGALYCAVAANTATALLALIASRFGSAKPTEPSEPTAPVGTAASSEPTHPRFALWAAATTGAVALAYEVAWMRLMAIFTSNSVYVFTMVVTVFLAALAVGSGLAARLLRTRRVDHLRALIGIQILLALIGPVVLAFLPQAAVADLVSPLAGARRVLLLEYALSVAVVFAPTVLIGMTLPLLLALVGDPLTRAGRSVGRLYAYNALGTIVGATLTGILLIPLLGLRGTLLGLAAVNFLIASGATALDRNPPARWRVATQCGAAGFVLLVVFLPATLHFRRPVSTAEETVLYYAEGPSATVHVSEFDGQEGRHRTLFVDSKSVAGTYQEIVTDQKMLAHLPLLLHPQPERALTVGFGTGGTSYSMLTHRVKVDCVEIEPRVVDAYRLFESENHGLVGPDHERLDFHLILDDARAWLQVAPEPYDVIVTDVTSIQYRGNGNLYTVEYFRLMRQRLAPDGLACAWVPLTGVTPDQLETLVRSFQAVYPHTSIWYMVNLPTDFAILVGSSQRLAIDLRRIAQRMARPGVQRDLAAIGLDNPYKLAACLLLAEQDVGRYTGAGPLHTDNRPVLDYLTPGSSNRNTLTVNLNKMLAGRSDASTYITRWPDDDDPTVAQATWQRWFEAAGHLMAGHAILRSGDPDRAAPAAVHYKAAAELTPEDPLTESLFEGLDTG
ncbi:MAG: fused MFS/spermidine synthase [Planctomycetes bacterium]|nr:fused MFS/spermidine synthase [Planctomycetota bacterium]